MTGTITPHPENSNPQKAAAVKSDGGQRFGGMIFGSLDGEQFGDGEFELRHQLLLQHFAPGQDAVEFEAELEAAGLRDDAIVMRITGCPNGCGRPFLAEIGLVGKSPGKYNLYLGAAANGSRLNVLYKASVQTAELLPLLGPIFRRYATERTPGESFGDFVIRAGYVKPTYTAHDFHEQAKVNKGEQI